MMKVQKENEVLMRRFFLHFGAWRCGDVEFDGEYKGEGFMGIWSVNWMKILVLFEFLEKVAFEFWICSR
jgi:hypothetical protein